MSAFIRYLAESGLCLVLFYAVYWVFMRKETTFALNRVYLVGSLLLSLVIPLLKVPSPFLTEAPLSAPLAVPPAVTAAGSRFDFLALVGAAYALGAALFLARFARQLGRLYRLVRKSRLQEIDGLRLVSVDQNFAPFSFLHYVFLNGRDFSPVNLRHILVHESAHVRQGHTLDILLMECVTILQWFNPIVRPYKKSIQETHEFLADGEVIAQGFNSANYQLLILEQQVGFRLMRFTSNFKQSQIKRRIVMMSQMRSKGAARLKVLLLVPLATLLVLALAQPRPRPPADLTSIAGLQDKADPSQDAQKKKEIIAKATANLAILKEKEAQLEKVLSSTTDAEKQQRIKSDLKMIAKWRQETEAFLRDPDTMPPPPPLPPPAPTGKAALKMLKEKEADLRKQLATETDQAVVKELEHNLQMILAKEKDVEAKLKVEAPAIPAPPAAPAAPAAPMAPSEPAPASPSLAPKMPQPPAMVEAPGAPPVNPPPPPDAKEMLLKLQQKEADVRKALETTEDAAEKAKLEETLKKIEQKRAQIQAQAVAQSYTLEDLKRISAELDQKEADIRAELQKTQDPQKTAELNDMLKKVQAKRAKVKAKMEELKKAPEK